VRLDIRLIPVSGLNSIIGFILTRRMDSGRVRLHISVNLRVVLALVSMKWWFWSRAYILSWSHVAGSNDSLVRAISGPDVVCTLA